MSKRIRKVLSTGLILLSITIFMFFASQPVYAGERDFTNTEKELVEEAIKFLQDNGTDDIGGKSASAELTSLLNKKAADGLNHIRRDTDKGLGDAAASTNGTISVGLPTEANINKDINTAEGFTQVKTLAQTLYHEWVHYRRFQQYGKFLIPALDQNWAKCQPLWDEVEAYYLEIKQKLSWKLARENELAGIPGYGPILGPPTPAQQARAEQLQWEIADLEKQIDEAASTTYLAAKRKVSPGSALRKSYEEGGTLIKDAFAGMNSNQAKHTEVTSRLNDISLFYAGATAQSIESRINEKVTAYQSKVTFLTLLIINWLTGGTLDIHFESYFMRLIIVPLGLYETETEEIEIEGFVVESEYMLPWQDLGCHILSPVYQVGTSLEVMANSDHPSTVTLSFNAEELEEGEEPHIYALRTESSGRSTADSSEASWAPLLVDEEIDLAAKTITAKCSDPFTLFVVMVEPTMSNNADTWTSGLYDSHDGVFHLHGLAPFRFGPRGSSWLPIAGDWNGSGEAAIGLYDPADGVFHLHGLAPFRYGPRSSSWLPVAGDWNGNGTESVGLYDPSDGVFHLQDSAPFRYGPRSSSWLPVAGDWNGNGTDSVGLYDPVDGVFHLQGLAPFRYGPRGSSWLPVAGDWNGSGTESVGLYDPSDGVFHLQGSAPVRYGPRGSSWRPLAGHW